MSKPEGSLSGKSLASAAARLAAGTVLGQVAVVLASPFVTRAFRKEDIATALTLSMVVTWLAPVAGLRFDAAVQSPASEEDADNLVRAGLASCVILSFVVLGLTIAFGPMVAAHLKNAQLATVLPVIAVTILGQGAFQSLNAHALRHRHYAATARTKVVQGWGTALTQVLTGLARWGTVGLVTADVLGRILGTWTMAAVSLQARPSLRDRWNIAAVRRVARIYRDFPVYNVPATLLHAGIATAPLLLNNIYGPVVFASFAIGVRMVWAPVSLLGQSLAQAVTGEAGKVAREDASRLRSAVMRTMTRLAVVGLVPFGLLGLAGPTIVPLVFGSKWALAGSLVQIQSFAWLTMFVVGPVLPLLAIVQRVRIQLWLDALGLGLVCGAMAAGAYFSWPIERTVLAMSGATALTYVALGLAVVAATSGPRSSA
ncbi:MAG: oligosaccharide flippase family protein [Fimbriimonadaceae bacterium]|nr:oligosaccharide flippase family protein [Fimbriimonadaceae bacterium]